MSFWHLEARYIKVKTSPRLPCPNPQYNSECQGLFIHTRRYQKECVSCMRLHHTIDKHPLLVILLPKYPLYPEYDIIKL